MALSVSGAACPCGSGFQAWGLAQGGCPWAPSVEPERPGVMAGVLRGGCGSIGTWFCLLLTGWPRAALGALVLWKLGSSGAEGQGKGGPPRSSAPERLVGTETQCMSPRGPVTLGRVGSEPHLCDSGTLPCRCQWLQDSRHEQHGGQSGLPRSHGLPGASAPPCYTVYHLAPESLPPWHAPHTHQCLRSPWSWAGPLTGLGSPGGVAFLLSPKKGFLSFLLQARQGQKCLTQGLVSGKHSTLPSGEPGCGAVGGPAGGLMGAGAAAHLSRCFPWRCCMGPCPLPWLPCPSGLAEALSPLHLVEDSRQGEGEGGLPKATIGDLGLRSVPLLLPAALTGMAVLAHLEALQGRPPRLFPSPRSYS